MARKEITLSIMDGGTEKKFRIRQMAVTKLEAWIAQALLLAGSTDINPTAFAPGSGDTSTDAPTGDMAAAGMKALAGLSYAKAKPLYDELLECCAIIVDGTFHDLSLDTADVHIEDVKTLFKLRMEAAKLNLDFFDFGALSKSMMTMMTGAGTTPTPTSPA